MESQGLSYQPGLRAVVLLTVRSVAQDVVDFTHNVSSHLRKDLGRRSKLNFSERP